jgi:hypothetical protein
MYILTHPEAEPVGLEEAKLAARVDGIEWDDIVTAAIKSARLTCEQLIGRRLMTTVERIELADWPLSKDVFAVYRPDAVDVSYWDGAQWLVLQDGVGYAWASVCSGFSVVPVLNGAFPVLGDIAIGSRVRIDATSGAPLAADVDEGAKTYIKALVSLNIHDPTMTANDAPNASLLSGLVDHLRVLTL